MARVIAEDFIQQVFVDNFFHADPHPGNVLIQPDGHVAYLDFGAVGRLDQAARKALLHLFHIGIACVACGQIPRLPA